MSEELDEIMLDRLRKLYESLRDQMRTKFNRHVSFGDLVADRQRGLTASHLRLLQIDPPEIRDDVDLELVEVREPQLAAEPGYRGGAGEGPPGEFPRGEMGDFLGIGEDELGQHLLGLGQLGCAPESFEKVHRAFAFVSCGLAGTVRGSP